MMQVGMGAEEGAAVVAVQPTGPTGPSVLDQFVGGARIWLSPSQVPTALSNLGAGWAASPLSVVGLLAVPAVVLALVWGMQGAKRRRNPGRRVARGRRHNKRRRNPGRRKPATRRRRPLVPGSKAARAFIARLKASPEYVPKRGEKRNPKRRKNVRSYAVRGQRVHPGYVPGPGKIFYLSGRKGVVKSVYQDKDGTMWVQFRRAVDGTTGMSLGNFRQAAYIE